MTSRFFLDTNVLLYADDAAAGPKQRRAQKIVLEALTTRRGVISTQVLQEYFASATRKLKLDAARARDRIETLLALEVIQVEVEHVLSAIDLHRLRGLSFWDALVTTTALSAGCGRLLTEDLQHGMSLSGMRIENPFVDESD